MATTHTIRTEYPLAGSEDGLPVEIKFSYSRGRPVVRYLRNGDPGYPAEPEEVEYHSVMPLCPQTLPAIIRAAIETWAREWLESDVGHGAACDKAMDDLNAAYEIAMKYRREA